MKRCVPVIYSWRIAILNAPFDIQKNMINWRANLNAKFWKKIDIVNLSCAFLLKSRFHYVPPPQQLQNENQSLSNL